ncbi:pantoate--beta-alanine ligase [Jatrophihabitans lederbergiae]|uniref:Pantothenate synthetase n=1 Tax=Jatrophihabitans lederbergiae TaxID=3075547 RepID=A0ABU2J7F1_9ACTN|nr:pantoate--beta-alanine ligase [Jatrophihabitans sp. DSM 44399]MDT0260912.1 pantoate--beta-alanine ligase [Jatrophihabitans sp. DSM 44399]
MTHLVRGRQELAAARKVLPGSVGLVPTMGALHKGHLANIRQAKARCESVVVSIFVNPMQFERADDLERYPRRLADDLAVCEAEGVDVVWAPGVPDVYPNGPAQVWVTAGELADQLEGPNRPGHFDGVLTVVSKLFARVAPDRAFFGEKDYQQLTLVRRLVADLDTDVEIIGVPTVREADGLALSSRNVFLSTEERRQALVLITALRTGRDAAGNASAVLEAAGTVLAAAEGVDVHYLELRDPQLGRAPASGPARLLVAASVGATRLIDNLAVELTG